MADKHDLLFFEKRSTPMVVPAGGKAEDNPKYDSESYGKQTKRRAATDDEEQWMRKNPGKWLRVDEHGNKGGEDGYKKTRMEGREHLVHSDEQSIVFNQFISGLPDS